MGTTHTSTVRAVEESFNLFSININSNIIARSNAQSFGVRSVVDHINCKKFAVVYGERTINGRHIYYFVVIFRCGGIK